MARTKQIIPGINNGQKFRFIVRQPEVVNSIDFGMTLTVQEFFNKCATTLVRHAVTEGLVTLSDIRIGQPETTGMVKRVSYNDHNNRTVELDVQVDLF